MHGKKARIRSSDVMASKRLTPPQVCFFNLSEEVNNVVRLAEVILDVVVGSMIAQLAELVLECSGLLEEEMYVPVYLH